MKIPMLDNHYYLYVNKLLCPSYITFIMQCNTKKEWIRKSHYFRIMSLLFPVTLSAVPSLPSFASYRQFLW